jgi:hypothetical protein
MAVSSLTGALSTVCDFIRGSFYGVSLAVTPQHSSVQREGERSSEVRIRQEESRFGASHFTVPVQVDRSSRATSSASPAVCASSTRRFHSSASSRYCRPFRVPVRGARASRGIRSTTPAAQPDTRAARSQCRRQQHQDARGVGIQQGGQDAAGAGLCATAPQQLQGDVLDRGGPQRVAGARLWPPVLDTVQSARVCRRRDDQCRGRCDRSKELVCGSARLMADGVRRR